VSVPIFDDERGKPPRALENVLEGYFRGAGLLQRSREELCAFLWPELAGGWYAEHTSVSNVCGGTLYVRCDSAPRAQQLQLDAPEIIRRINERMGEELIREIRPSSGGIARRRAVESAPRDDSEDAPDAGELAAIKLPPEQVEQIIELAEGVDSELRDTLERIMLTQARIDIWRRDHGWTQCPGCGVYHRDSDSYCLSCDRPEPPSQAGGEEGLSAFFR
jgi:hypothetical protein